MGTWIFLMRASETASLGAISIGSPALERQETALRGLGAAKVTSVPVLGSFDLVITADLPSDIAALAAMYALNANGFFVDILHALDPADLDAARDLVDGLRETFAQPDETVQESPASREAAESQP